MSQYDDVLLKAQVRCPDCGGTGEVDRPGLVGGAKKPCGACIGSKPRGYVDRSMTMKELVTYLNSREGGKRGAGK